LTSVIFVTRISEDPPYELVQ